MWFSNALVCLLLVGVAISAAQAQEFAWAKSLGGTSDDYGYSIAVDSQGNVYTAGYFYGTADFDPGPGVNYLTSAGGADIFVSKLDSNGNSLWAKRMGGPSDDFANAIAVDREGNVYTTGYFFDTADFDPGPSVYNLTSAGYADIFVSKLDTNGNFVWARRMGGASDEYGYSIAVNSAGNVYTTGFFYDTADFDPGVGVYNLTSAGDADIFVSKLDLNGNFVWAKRMGGAGLDTGKSIAVDSAGNVYTTGDFMGAADFDPGAGVYNLTSAGGADIFVSKLDPNGAFVWAKGMGGTSVDGGRSITVDGAGDVFTTGSFAGAADFDPGPGVYNLTSAGSDDIFVSKLDPGGAFVWAERMGGTYSDIGNSIALDSAGNVYTTGSFSGDADFDPGPGEYNLTSAGGADIFVSKLDPGGNLVWAKRMGGNSADYGKSIAVDRTGNVYTTGLFSGTADFDPSGGIYNLMSAGGADVFVSKLRGCGSSFVEQGGYGSLLFRPLCTANASGLAQDVYNSRTLTVFKGANDRLFLSSEGKQFAPLVVDDAVHVNGLNSGLGPYAAQPGGPPFVLGVPIEENWIPAPAQEISSLVPLGRSSVLFELLDTDRGIYGNTSVYLVLDCRILLQNSGGQTAINWVSRDDRVAGGPPDFEVRYGLLSHLRADRNFSRSACLGRFNNTPATDPLGNPPAKNAYYYLARGLSSCVAQGFGDSSLTPDPRDALDALPPCP